MMPVRKLGTIKRTFQTKKRSNSPVQDENGCWNCTRSKNARGSQIWCPYWQAYFSIDHTDCNPPAFVPIVMDIMKNVPASLIW